jgi:hypothetical protein
MGRGIWFLWMLGGQLLVLRILLMGEFRVGWAMGWRVLILF